MSQDVVSRSNSLRSRHAESVHRVLRAKLAKAGHLLFVDEFGSLRGESLLALNRAVSAFLEDAHLARSKAVVEASYFQATPSTPKKESTSRSKNDYRRKR